MQESLRTSKSKSTTMQTHSTDLKKQNPFKLERESTCKKKQTRWLASLLQKI